MLAANTPIWLSEPGHYQFLYRSDTVIEIPMDIAFIIEHHKAIVEFESEYQAIVISSDIAKQFNTRYTVVWVKNERSI